MAPPPREFVTKPLVTMKGREVRKRLGSYKCMFMGVKATSAIEESFEGLGNGLTDVLFVF